MSEKNNAPHIAESTVLYHIDEVFEGDIQISLQDGPEFSHHIGQTESEKVARRGLTLEDKPCKGLVLVKPQEGGWLSPVQ